MLQGSFLSVFSVGLKYDGNELNGFFNSFFNCVVRWSCLLSPPNGLEPLVSDLHDVPHGISDLKQDDGKWREIAHYYANWAD